MSVDGMLGVRCLSVGMGVPELGGFPYNFLFNGPSPKNRPVPYLQYIASILKSSMSLSKDLMCA